MSADVQSVDPAIAMDGVRIVQPRNPGVVLIDDVCWTVMPGEFWVVAGLQGSGKTALLETASGLSPQAHGSVRVFGEGVDGGRSESDELPGLRRRLGLVFEGGGRLFPGLNVFENIALPWCYHRNVSLADAAVDLAPLIAYLRLDKLLDQAPGRIGRAWARRVALGRALALGPELLLLDNPLSGLDTAQMRWWRTFLSDASRGHPALGGVPLTLVVASDELRPLLPLGQRFALAHDGRWRILGTGADVLAARGEDGVRDIFGETD
jgi:ABC-type transporter Mla maintaining outer membrane lipid asymmetry ATPase subunit MlaF